MSFVPQLDLEVTEEDSEQHLEAISVGVPSALLLACFARYLLALLRVAWVYWLMHLTIWSWSC